MKYTCPAAVAIPDLTLATCLENFGQIQKAAFQRVYSAAGVKNTMPTTGAGDIHLRASWDVFLAAADGTKMQVSPDIEEPVVTPGAARTKGGGNATIGGITKTIGREATSNTFMLNVYQQSVIEELKEYQQELSLGVYLFNEYGQIGCIKDATTATTYYPIPIARQTFFIGDKKIGGLEDEDGNVMSFQFLPNWSDKFAVVTPTDFNPLTDLVNS